MYQRIPQRSLVVWVLDVNMFKSRTIAEHSYTRRTVLTEQIYKHNIYTYIIINIDKNTFQNINYITYIPHLWIKHSKGGVT